MRIEEALESFEIYLKAVENKSIKTVEAYMSDLQAYTSFLLERGKTKIEEISILDLDAFLISTSEIMPKRAVRERSVRSALFINKLLWRMLLCQILRGAIKAFLLRNICRSI